MSSISFVNGNIVGGSNWVFVEGEICVFVIEWSLWLVDFNVVFFSCLVVFILDWEV